MVTALGELILELRKIMSMQAFTLSSPQPERNLVGVDQVRPKSVFAIDTGVLHLRALILRLGAGDWRLTRAIPRALYPVPQQIYGAPRKPCAGKQRAAPDASRLNDLLDQRSLKSKLDQLILEDQ